MAVRDGYVQPFPHTSSKTLLVQANVSNEQQVVDCVKQTAAWKPIDIIILNQGIFVAQDVPIIDMSMEQFNNTLHVNLTGYYLFARAFLQQAKAHQLQYGNIVMIGSTVGIFGEAGHADYAASKSAIQYGFLFSLKNEIVHTIPNGRVNVVAPGWYINYQVLQ